jgi:foldase protein PrsA
MHIRSFLFGLATAALVSGAFAFAQGTRVGDDTVLADVNGQKITYKQLLDQLLDEHAAPTLDALINRLVVKQAADQAQVTVTDADVDRRLAEVKRLLSSADPSRAERNYRDWLQTSGLSERQHREQIRYTLLQEGAAMKASPVTDADLERLSVRVIACNSKQKAMELLNRLRLRSDFAELARIESDDPTARQTGGLLEPFTRLQAPTMWMHASKLTPGQYTHEPVQAANGFVIIKLEARMPASTLKPPERQQLTAMVRAYRVNRWFENAKKAAKISYPTPLKQIVPPPAAGG